MINYKYFLSPLDPVRAQHWNVWRDAGHDPSSAWQDVIDMMGHHEPEICCLRYTGDGCMERQRHREGQRTG